MASGSISEQKAEAPAGGALKTGNPAPGKPVMELIQGKGRGVILSPRISNLNIFAPLFKAAAGDYPCSSCLLLPLEIKLHLYTGQFNHIVIIQLMRLVAQ